MADLQLGKFDIHIPDFDKKLAERFSSNQTFDQLDVAPQRQNLVEPLVLKGSDSVTLDQQSKLVIGGSVTADFAASVYNDASDVDEEKIVELTANHAWARYSVGASLKGSASGTVGAVGFGLDGERSVRALDYRRHPLTQPAVAQVLQDLTAPRFAVDLQDIAKLQDGDALALVIRGKLAFRASVTYGDVFSTTLGALDRMLGVTGASAITLRAGASLSVDLQATDDFRIVFRKGTQKDVRVEVKKAKGSRKGLSAGLVLEAGFSDPTKLADLVETYLLGRLGLSVTQLRQLLQKVANAPTLTNLATGDRKTALTLAEQLGFLDLSDLEARWESFKEKVAGLEGKLQGKLEEVLKQKVSLSFSFSYTRIETNETVFAFDITSAQLARHHRDLILGNLSKVVQAVRDDSAGADFVLHEYLKTDIKQTTRSFGINLTIGSWGAAGVTKETERFRRQESIDGNIRISFDGRKSYEGKFGGDKVIYAFELSSAMRDFSPEPHSRDFQYTMSLGWFWEDKLKDLILDFLDLGVVWRGWHPVDQEGIRSSIGNLSGKVKAEIELTFSDQGLESLAEVDRATFEKAWIDAMAVSLPLVPQGKSEPLRASIKDRMELYRNAAAGVFEQPFGTDVILVPQYRTDLEKVRLRPVDLSPQDPKGLFELWQPRPSDGNGRPALRCQRAFNALTILGRLTKGQPNFRQVKDVFDTWADLLTQPFPCRLMGNVFTRILRDRGLSDQFSVSAQITQSNGDVIVVG